jgi:hypothetical protein
MKEYLNATFCSDYKYKNKMIVSHDQCKTRGLGAERFSLQKNKQGSARQDNEL